MFCHDLTPVAEQYQHSTADDTFVYAPFLIEDINCHHTYHFDYFSTIKKVKIFHIFSLPQWITVIFSETHHSGFSSGFQAIHDLPPQP